MASARRLVKARDGDKLQARGRVNYLVRIGMLPHPNDLPCTDCNHIAVAGEPHGYDHFLGYSAEHHEDVQAVCARCSNMRSVSRGEIKIEDLRRAAKARSDQRLLSCKRGHLLERGGDGMWRCHQCRLQYWRDRDALRKVKNCG